MARSHDVFVLLGAYDNDQAAEDDLAAVKELHSEGVIGTYDAAVVSKDDGHVHVHKIEKPTRHGAWTGIGVGAVVGVLFPPSIIGTALVGGAAGGLFEHVTKGMSRSDLKDLGETLDSGQAALIVIGRDKMAEQLDKATVRAQRKVEKALDVDGEELDKQLAAAGQEL